MTDREPLGHVHRLDSETFLGLTCQRAIYDRPRARDVPRRRYYRGCRSPIALRKNRQRRHGSKPPDMSKLVGTQTNETLRDSTDLYCFKVVFAAATCLGQRRPPGTLSPLNENKFTWCSQKFPKSIDRLRGPSITSDTPDRHRRVSM